MSARIEHVVTSGTFSLDGGTWDVDNNVWLIGDDSEVLVIDPAHDAEAVLEAIGGRTVAALVCTHGHDDHINAVAQIADKVGAPILIHSDDRALWTVVYPDREPDLWLVDRAVLEAAGTTFEVLSTPGHTYGSISLYTQDLGAVFTGDTLFAGGPGATGRSYSHFPTIITSIRERLLTLPPDTVVHTGHGPTTTIGAEAPQLDDWIKRGH
ncbi:Glyoxylase, beta-lactamase superfamily II [Lentzea albidocapillata subsp. violacea]|uniref:Glyoxylase, beta-lactamase superfamily II n=1 Tax=Lentzea albidocapillata subsp. violacea TaxID=128104 RepID=A0A1G8QDX2_9PSEU|nr:MBL fold metallo-hydrolase [Lentzea albidocapillata]SDJ02984.1 Glyoxylase, beta-lactamase superfamily II [Lentzea albidocapillata subsp. violacea]